MNVVKIVLSSVFLMVAVFSCKDQSVLPQKDAESISDNDFVEVQDINDEYLHDSFSDEADQKPDISDESADEDIYEIPDMADEVSDPDIIEIVDDEEPLNYGPCTKLFGRPSDKTGLGPDMCVPECDCNGKRFVPPVYTKEDVDKFINKVLLNPPEALTSDPYEDPENNKPQHDKFCGYLKDKDNPDGYWLNTYDNIEELEKAGAVLTHTGACGKCSTLKDLAVYILVGDLTGPVRQCGVDSTIGGEEKNIKCLMDLGFQEECAQIWYYNTKHTKSVCLAQCLIDINKPYHKPDGSLNDCIQCDEDKSGDVFKAVAGRTRRNTGLPSALCRPCSEAYPIYHNYE